MSVSKSRMEQFLAGYNEAMHVGAEQKAFQEWIDIFTCFTDDPLAKEGTLEAIRDINFGLTETDSEGCSWCGCTVSHGDRD